MSAAQVLVSMVVIVFIYCYLINIVAEYWDCTYGAQAGAILHSGPQLPFSGST